MLREEVKETVHSLKAGKSPGADNIASELLTNRGQATITVLHFGPWKSALSHGKVLTFWFLKPQFLTQKSSLFPMVCNLLFTETIFNTLPKNLQI